MELFSHGFETNKHRSDAHRIQHTWEPQLTLPDIPKPVDPDESQKGSKSKTHKRRKISYDFSNTNDDDDDGEPRYVSVRPDMIVVRTKRGERMDMGEGKREAPSRCISVLEMKREGVLSCRVSNLKSVAGTPIRLPPVAGANRRFARGGRHNTCMKTTLDPGSVNLIKQAIVYALTFRVRFVVISDYNTTAFFQFTEMKTGARVGIKKLWETGVGESMDMSILEEDESADVRAAWLGFLATADAELNKSLY
ncbi:hypothetical protein QIS74_12011 [Colletotrichum tabaci]|uniref:Uncharacterized protein n=1 Tax=Colletotrichum tabaci TaxID=1209068 RepID=A0AAV9SVJ4_9PEZI